MRPIRRLWFRLLWRLYRQPRRHPDRPRLHRPRLPLPRQCRRWSTYPPSPTPCAACSGSVSDLGVRMTEIATTASAELDRAIIDASRELIAAQRARPRDPVRIAAAKAEYDAL